MSVFYSQHETMVCCIKHGILATLFEISIDHTMAMLNLKFNIYGRVVLLSNMYMVNNDRRKFGQEIKAKIHI